MPKKVKKVLTEAKLKKDVEILLNQASIKDDPRALVENLIRRYKKYRPWKVLRVMANVILEKAAEMEQEDKELLPIKMVGVESCFNIDNLGHLKEIRRKSKPRKSRRSR